MANVEYDDEGWYDGPTEAHDAGRGFRSRKLVNGAGALTSLALVLGLGVWGYKLAVRDVNGVPVIRALAGPARVAPSDPGGELADHQGLAVNTIAADGAAAAPAERLVLAPRPMELSPEDQPMPDVRVASVAQQGGTAGQASALEATAAMPVPQADPINSDFAGSDAVAVRDLADAGATTNPIANAVTEAVAAIPADVPGVSRSLRPQGRPAMMALVPDGASDPIAEAAAAAVAAALSGSLGVEAAAAPADTAVTDALAEASGTPVAAPLPTSVEPTSAQAEQKAAPAAGPVEPASNTFPAGTRLAQLGAFQSVEEARTEWDKAITDLGPLMQGKKRVIETAQSGGRTFYRLRVQGFADLADARRFCAALKAEGRLCTPAQAQG